MLSPGSEFSLDEEMERFGRESLALYPRFLEELEEASGRGIDFRLCGALELLFEGTGELSGEDVTEMVPDIAPGVAGAIQFREEGQVDPRTVMSAFGRALPRSGVTVLEGHRVARIRVTRDEAVAETNSGPVAAGKVVVAAGAWSGAIEATPIRLPATMPVRGHLLGYHWPPGRVPPLLRFDHTYVVQRNSGFTIVGATEERVGFDRRVDRGLVEELRRRAARLIPRLAEEEPDEVWVGFRPATSNLRPEIRQWEDSPVWLAYGHYRNGILLAPATAERMVAALGA